MWPPGGLPRRKRAGRCPSRSDVHDRDSGGAKGSSGDTEPYMASPGFEHAPLILGGCKRRRAGLGFEPAPLISRAMHNFFGSLAVGQKYFRDTSI